MYILRSWLNLVWPNATLNGPQRARFDMADLKKLKKVRGTTTASVSILIARYKDILQENFGDQEDELIVLHWIVFICHLS